MRNRGEPRDPVHEGHARRARVRLLGSHRGRAQSLDQPFAAVDILPDPRIRQELSGLSGWPTIPQLFVDGELVGGCDIVTEMYQSGELQKALGLEAPPAEEAPEAQRRRGRR